MSAAPASWVCCHLGAREHYVVPRALHQSRRLGQLITDAWSEPRTIKASIAASVSTRFSQRFHPDLAGANVRALSRSLLAHEMQWRLQRREGWDLLMARNDWFQQEAAAILPKITGERTMLFAHSYSAEAIFTEGKRRNWTTVLGQIDPGPEHILTQDRLSGERPEFGAPPEAPPYRYFDKWRNECELADWIIVNSDWSRESLIRAGVDERKLRTIPLPYEREPHEAFTRAYPPAFTSERPLRVLFVGTASVAKGVADLLLAFDRLGDAPIELHIVGDRAMEVPERFLHHPRIHWVGRVDRAGVMQHYRADDLLMFPSHSDGFGMAQIEAQGWGLPIVASRHCGRVVREGENGLVLDEVTPDAIAAALRRVMGEPQTLDRFARNSESTSAPGIDALAAGLIALERQ
ncbi:MAG: glycosyltransferase family 4 protein [Cyanobacteria bacterium]|nr:glycosyltransferase family 4 protein [Cyanobacteriota bacterium]